MSHEQASAPVETELKFRLNADAVAKLEETALFARPADVASLRSVYFDTDAHSLRSAGLTLRVRDTGSGYVQTVKQASGAGLFDRGEWEHAVSGTDPDLHLLAGTPAESLLQAGDEVRPVFETAVERAARIWTGESSLVEVSLDTGEIRADDQREPILELELELKKGSAHAVFDLAHELSAAVPMTLSFETKSERGYRLAQGQALAPFRAQAPGLDPSMAAAEAFRHIARSCLAQIADNGLLLRSFRSAEVLHQTRIGLRRFRAALAAFDHMLDDAEVEGVKTEAKWLAKELDDARDLDVLAAGTFPELRSQAGGDQAPDMLQERLSAAKARAYDRALAAVGSPRFGRFLLVAATWAQAGGWTRSGPGVGVPTRDLPAVEAAAAILDRLARRVRKAGKRLDKLDAEERHKVRIKAKKLRYAVEFFGGLFESSDGKRVHKFTKVLKAFQDELGKLNDLAVAERRVGALVDGASPEVAFRAGVMVGVGRGDETALLRKATQCYAALAKAKPFW